jgi:hypothetical protein
MIAVEATEDLVRGEPVMVWVIPIHPGRVRVGKLEFIVERLARADHHQRIVAVALWGDVKTVSVKVRYRREPVF